MHNTDSTALARSHALVTTLARNLQAGLIETHLSWVLLAGDSAWKIKKPVRLPFVDYGSLQARRHFCEEELRLNRRFAPSLYLGVAAITGPPEAPAIDGAGPVLEYAVQMRRFAQEALLSRQLDAATLSGQDVDQLAALLAHFHTHAPQASAAAGFASPDQRRAAALAALEGARALASPAEHDQLRHWLDTQAAALAPLWALRREGGFVRECHGDLHLDNVVRLEAGPVPFDGIEFDPALRWIDVLDDIAFAMMDFNARGRRDLAFRLINQWLDHSGDHGALPALRFSLVYRALVRAQVQHLRGAGHEASARRYLDTALAWARPGQPRLSITHGLPGSGKTFESQRVLESEGAIRLRSDVERKRLFGLGPLEDSRATGLDIYTREATARTYAQLLASARLALQAGYPVVLDAAFLQRAEREQAQALAAELGLPFAILDCKAAPQVLRARLLARQSDPSEANAAVLELLRTKAEPLTQEEQGLVLQRPPGRRV